MPKRRILQPDGDPKVVAFYEEPLTSNPKPPLHSEILS